MEVYDYNFVHAIWEWLIELCGQYLFHTPFSIFYGTANKQKHLHNLKKMNIQVFLLCFGLNKTKHSEASQRNVVIAGQLFWIASESIGPNSKTVIRWPKAELTQSRTAEKKKSTFELGNFILLLLPITKHSSSVGVITHSNAKGILKRYQLKTTWRRDRY